MIILTGLRKANQEDAEFFALFNQQPLTSKNRAVNPPAKRAAKRKEPELTYSKSSKKTDDTKEEVPVPMKRRRKNSLSPKKASARILERQNDVAATNEKSTITLLRQLLVNLPRQLPEASEYDFAFGQPFEDDLDDDDVRALYHDSLANIFGTHASIRNTMRERRLEMDSSVLWGRRKHAIAIADDFERVFASVPGDGPMLQWVENLISMAQTSYALFNKEYESSSIHESETQHNPPATSVSTHDTNSNTLQPLQSKFYHAPPLVRLTQGANGRLFAVNKGDELSRATLLVRTTIGDCRVSDLSKTKHRVIKSKLFIDDDHYDGDGGINAGGIDSGGIDNGGIDSRGIGNSGIADGGITDGGIADGGIADGGIADGRIDDGGIATVESMMAESMMVESTTVESTTMEATMVESTPARTTVVEDMATHMNVLSPESGSLSRAPSAWTGFQKTFKERIRKPRDQRCMDDEASKDLTKVLNGGRAKVMDCIGNQLSRQARALEKLNVVVAGYVLCGDPSDSRAVTQNSFFGTPAVAKACTKTWHVIIYRHYCSNISQTVLCHSSVFLWVWGKRALNAVFGWLDGLRSSNSPTGVVNFKLVKWTDGKCAHTSEGLWARPGNCQGNEHKRLVRTLNKLDAEEVSSKVHKTSQRAAIASVRVPSGCSTDLPALSLPDEVDRVNPLSPTFTVDSYDSSCPPTHANDVTIATMDPSVGNSSVGDCMALLSGEKYPVSADSDQPTRAHPPLSPNPRNPNHAPPQEDRDRRNSESHVENSGPHLDRDGQNSGPYLQNTGPRLDRDGRNSESHVENSGPHLDHDGQNSGPYLQNTGPRLDRDGRNSESHVENSGPHLDRDGQNSGPYLQNARPCLDRDRRNLGPYLQNAGPHLDRDGRNSGPYLQNAGPCLNRDRRNSESYLDPNGRHQGPHLDRDGRNSGPHLDRDGRGMGIHLDHDGHLMERHESISSRNSHPFNGPELNSRATSEASLPHQGALACRIKGMNMGMTQAMNSTKTAGEMNTHLTRSTNSTETAAEMSYRNTNGNACAYSPPNEQYRNGSRNGHAYNAPDSWCDASSNQHTQHWTETPGNRYWDPGSNGQHPKYWNQAPATSTGIASSPPHLMIQMPPVKFQAGQTLLGALKEFCTGQPVNYLIS
ncbi:hypothetical protein BS47DRAFT_1365735 [Hydnum rufescens UP504]|uniref:Uncharacterized protein n=1 Tax=Hydnum rufescens UP504 TaxID=1448309 RepID=A0A9P6ANX3_9AGAM|nr:hypothetical protein BS47DRAFT_1365735 [Hydnum rufescens UP504]